MMPAALEDIEVARLDDEGLDDLGDSLLSVEEPARDDLSLCFLCMRWCSGDPRCKAGIRCEYQITLDRLES